MRKITYLFALFIVFVSSGCASVPKDQEWKTVRVYEISEGKERKVIKLNSEIRFDRYTVVGSGLAKFVTTDEVILLPGNYVEHKENEHATYYVAMGQTVKVKALGVTSTLPNSGIKVPHNPKENLSVWTRYSMTYSSYQTVTSYSSDEAVIEYPTLEEDVRPKFEGL